MLREQPAASGALVVCIAISLFATAALLSQSRRAAMAGSAVAALSAAQGTPRPRGTVAHILPMGADLPPLQSSELVTILNDTATESGLVLNEVTYSLDENNKQPYLRYRVTMTLHASYPLIRRLAEQLSAKVPHLTLDAIDCSRKDVVVAELSCDMAMSGFFRKGPRG